MTPLEILRAIQEIEEQADKLRAQLIRMVLEKEGSLAARVRAIETMVALRCAVKPDELRARARPERIAWPRALIAWLVRETLHLDRATAASLLGLDRSTYNYRIISAERSMISDPHRRSLAQSLLKDLAKPDTSHEQTSQN